MKQVEAGVKAISLEPESSSVQHKETLVDRLYSMSESEKEAEMERKKSVSQEKQRTAKVGFMHVVMVTP